jgi:uncharacterized phiE125 gp8 family phage protein
MFVARPAHSRLSDFFTLDDLKLFLRVDHDDEDDVITALADAAITWCENYCNRKFATGLSATFYLSSFRSASLAYGPVTSITSVLYDDTTGFEQTLDASKYYYDRPGQNPIRIYFHDVPDVEDYNSQPVRVVAAVGEAPTNEVKHAVRLLVGHWYENRRTVVTGTIATSIPFAVEALLSSQRIIDMRQ